MDNKNPINPIVELPHSKLLEDHWKELLKGRPGGVQWIPPTESERIASLTAEVERLNSEASVLTSRVLKAEKTLGEVSDLAASHKADLDRERALNLHYIEGAGRYFERAEFLLQHGDAFVDHLHDIGETEAAHQLLAMLKEKGDG